MAELKPCCEKAKIIVKQLNVYDKGYYCQCMSCGSISGTYKTKEQAISAWNKRS